MTQARASVNQARVNLSKTVITSPIDGIVISRNVDVGQTVAASLSAPVIFVIAADLTRMRLNASIDESDLGRIKEGQAVTFTVDAYPQDMFEGIVEQVRLNPVVTSNVVTYAAIISAPNAELKLKPGMTASLNVEIARRDNVLRVPAAALRFRPNAGTLAALHANASVPARAAGENTGTVWTYRDGAATPVTVKLGVGDGNMDGAGRQLARRRSAARHQSRSGRFGCLTAGLLIDERKPAAGQSAGRALAARVRPERSESE